MADRLEFQGKLGWILEEAKETQEEAPGIVPAEKKYGVVAVCAGGGLASVFRDLGVDGIISGGQTMNPSTEDILREIARCPTTRTSSWQLSSVWASLRAGKWWSSPPAPCPRASPPCW